MSAGLKLYQNNPEFSDGSYSDLFSSLYLNGFFFGRLRH